MLWTLKKSSYTHYHYQLWSADLFKRRFASTIWNSSTIQLKTFSPLQLLMASIICLVKETPILTWSIKPPKNLPKKGLRSLKHHITLFENHRKLSHVLKILKKVTIFVPKYICNQIDHNYHETFLVIFKHCVISKQQSVIVTAFTWDGKAYKPVGKVGLAILTKEEKPLMVLYKSKQQTLSTLDLSQEQLKVEHQSENVLGTLDMQVKISKCLKVYYVKKRSLLKLSR